MEVWLRTMKTFVVFAVTLLLINMSSASLKGNYGLSHNSIQAFHQLWFRYAFYKRRGVWAFPIPCRSLCTLDMCNPSFRDNIMWCVVFNKLYSGTLPVTVICFMHVIFMLLQLSHLIPTVTEQSGHISFIS